MIVQMNKQGVVTLTAENIDENNKLFQIANEANFKGQTTYGSNPEAEEAKPKRTYKKRSTTYNKSCPVIGCDHKAKSIVLHLRNKHGILPDGTLTKTFTYNGGRGNKTPLGSHARPVTMPVKQRADGKYEVIEPASEKSEKSESNSGLLGHTESFTRSRILK